MTKGGRKMLLIKQKRKEKAIKQSELASLTGIKTSTLSQYETGKRQPSIEILNKLANVLDCRIDDLVSKEE